MPGVTAVGGWIVEYSMLGMISGQGPGFDLGARVRIGNPEPVADTLGNTG